MIHLTIVLAAPEKTLHIAYINGNNFIIDELQSTDSFILNLQTNLEKDPDATHLIHVGYQFLSRYE